jgi:hypothetical protein
LPPDVQTNIYAGFIYYDFLTAFEGTFYIEKPENEFSSQENSYYTWNDHIYQDLMLMILENLEPRFESKGSYLFDNREVREVLFINKGKVDVGYMYNDKEKFVIRYEDATVFGAYNCSYNQSTDFIFFARSDCYGYSISKKNWHSILYECPHITNAWKDNISEDYTIMKARMRPTS